ncbi:DUF317 domain-containing protein [Streptomyces sp. NPDC002896]|uniref:DUF317 domain-containing protein n=1 Tax=Streptomyces sp. NPDC002896 TaxID=3154438 RepID=UPI00333374B1
MTFPHDPAQHPRDVDTRWHEYRVTPRYLAGSLGIGDPGFAPVPADWPRYEPDDLGSFVVTSPDRRIHIGWNGDDYLLWRIGAYDGTLGARHWLATANHATPPEIVAGLTSALVRDYGTGEEAFLARPSQSWRHAAQPLLDAGWTRQAAEYGTVEIVAPDQLAGLSVDVRDHGPDSEAYTFWAGPPGWGTRAEITLTARTPDHLVVATAAALVDPRPVLRERQHIHRDVEHAVQLEPVEAVGPATAVPTPQDVRRTAVSAAMARAEQASSSIRRVSAARSRSAPRTTMDLPATTTAATPPTDSARRAARR